MNVTTMTKRRGDESPDPLRQQLAAALVAESEARAAIVSAGENLKRGHAVVAAAKGRLDSAKALVENAREHDSRATAAAVRNKSSGAAPDASSTRKARLAVQECEDDVEVAEGAIGRLQDDLAQAQAAAQWTRVETMAARNAVLAPICQELVDRVRDARRVLAVSKAALTLLLYDPARGVPEFRDDNGLDGMKARQQITAPLAELRAQAEQVQMLNALAGEREAAEAAVAEMQAFLARLATDSSAEPPPLP